MTKTTGKFARTERLTKDGISSDSHRNVPDVDAVTGHLDGIDDEGRLLFKEEGEARSVPVFSSEIFPKQYPAIAFFRSIPKGLFLVAFIACLIWTN